MQRPIFVVGMLGALATGILAAVASFKVSLPDSSRWWLVLPVPALVIWVSTISYGCLTDWVSIGSERRSHGRGRPMLCDAVADERAFVDRNAGDASLRGFAASHGGLRNRRAWRLRQSRRLRCRCSTISMRRS